ncbi:MAG: DUF6492 family protein [Cyanobacteria bacterium P01_E01_bin.35]
MTPEAFDFVIPLYRVRWNTRAVLEGITFHYQPRSIHIIAPVDQVRSLKQQSLDWQTCALHLHEEETFFNSDSLSKEKICAELDLGKSLYTPGWFYQQLLKLGAYEAIDNLSEWYVVWDSDLLPVDTWSLINQQSQGNQHSFALLQHNGWGNNRIVSQWEQWITEVLGVKAISNHEGTFIPHHMWFKQQHLKSFARQLNQYYKSELHWLLLMMRSANEFGTFSEYWSYVSWVSAQAPQDLAFYPYESYGSSTERFFDDGTGLFSKAMRKWLNLVEERGDFCPAYRDIESFIRAEYDLNSLPSSLSFESSPRHLKKDEENMHIEERRSRWNPRNMDSRIDVA